MPILTTQYYVDEATKPLHAEIESLRKQVKEWQDIANRYAKYEEQADEQLALHELEILRLREALEEVEPTIPFTPSNLNAYVESEIEKRFGAQREVNNDTY